MEIETFWAVAFQVFVAKQAKAKKRYFLSLQQGPKDIEAMGNGSFHHEYVVTTDQLARSFDLI